MTSKALEDFATSLGYASALVRLEETYQDPPTTPDESNVLGLRGGAAVLAVAAFENFLHAMFLERMAVLAVPGAVDFDKLPQKVKITGVCESLNLAMRGPLGQRTERAARIPDIVRVARIVGAPGMSPEAFAVAQSSPGPGTVKDMFANAGVRNVFEKAGSVFYPKWPKAEANTFLEDKLEEIVNRRHAVAHAVDVRLITRSQLAESMDFLRTLAEALDKVLEEHVLGLQKRCAPRP